VNTDSGQRSLGDFFSFSSPSPKQKSLFTHPLKSGWLLPYLIPLDAMFTKRYEHYLKSMEKGQIIDEPIPKIDFSALPHLETVNNLVSCLDFAERKGYSNVLPDFVNWILWGLKSPHQELFPANITEDISHYWYKTFNLGLLLKYPTDYFLHLSSGSHLRGNQGKRVAHHKARGYFATPPNVAQMMTEIAMGNTYSKEQAAQLVLDPCGGTGIFSLCASNYSINLCYIDIDNVLAQYARLNFHLYVPWMIYPCYLKGMKKMAKKRTIVGNALLPETDNQFEIVTWKESVDST